MTAQRTSLLFSHLLCLLIVLAVSWPALKAPRLEADDYRYLHNIQQVAAGNMAVAEAATVENRWDHLWFMEEDGLVHFFRPTVVLSYALDWHVWGDQYPFGLTLTNVLIHLGCAMLVGFLLHRWLGPGLPTILSTALFAALWTHGECIWYVAGRTDSLAALGFLGTIALHVSNDDRPALRWWAVLCFTFGFITKELVVAAPVVLMAYDHFVSRRRIEWKLYAAYGLAAAAVLGIKQLALAGEGSDFVYPYLISPLHPGFGEHLWLQLRSYSGNLLFAEWTVPFADAETISAMNSGLAPALAILLLLGFGFVLRRDGRFWLLLLLGATTWLPASFVYLSERYLYLPSVAFVALLGLLVSTRPKKWQTPLAVLLGAYVAFHAVKLYGKHIEITDQPGSVREMTQQIESVRGKINKGGHLLIVNQPGMFVRAQFTQEILRVVLNDPELSVDVLTMMPGQNGTLWKPGDPPPLMGAGVQLHRKGTHALVLQGGRQRIQEYGLKRFAWSKLDGGRTYRTSTGLEARVLAGGTNGAIAIEFVLPEPLATCQILVWEADHRNLNDHPWVRRENASVRLVEL
ncbi:MAG: hypothetical protein KAU94_04680 [Verrucomicrobia bacterium]|nr:hypothetical protein [Verrucomicrobiota bacterium]